MTVVSFHHVMELDYMVRRLGHLINGDDLQLVATTKGSLLLMDYSTMARQELVVEFCNNIQQLFHYACLRIPIRSTYEVFPIYCDNNRISDLFFQTIGQIKQKVTEINISEDHLVRLNQKILIMVNKLVPHPGDKRVMGMSILQENHVFISDDDPLWKTV